MNQVFCFEWEYFSVIFLIQFNILLSISQMFGYNFLGLTMVNIPKTLTVPIHGTNISLVMVLDSSPTRAHKLILCIWFFGSDFFPFSFHICKPGCLEFLSKGCKIISVISMFFIPSDKSGYEFAIDVNFYQNVFKDSLIRYLQLWYKRVNLLFFWG